MRGTLTADIGYDFTNEYCSIKALPYTQEIVDFIGDNNILTYNGNGFDIPFLKTELNKYGYDIDEDCWVGDDPGTIAMISDMFVSMDNIRYDVDNNIPIETYEEWYWKSLEVYELTEQNYMNYESFCKGAPDIWTDERLKSIKEAKFRVEEAKKALDEEINRYKEEELPEEF